MTLHEERLKILQMVADGAITPEDGARLLEALEGGTEPTTAAGVDKPRRLKIRVTDTRTGRSRVNITLPYALLRAGLRLGAKFRVPGMDKVDARLLQEVESAFLQGTEAGKIVDVIDEEEGERVEIYVE